MNFFYKIFSKKPVPELKQDTTKQTLPIEKKVEIPVKQETKPEISLLKCSGCRKEYVIGKDAVVVCLESQAPGTKILVVYDDDTERVDLVAPIDSSNKGAFERAKPGWKTIQDSLAHGQKRKWKCNLCNQVNSYPDFYSAIENSPKAKVVSKIDNSLIEVLYDQAYDKLKKEDNTGAIEDYSRVIALNPNHGLAYYERAVAKFGIDDYSGALADARIAVKLGVSDENEMITMLESGMFILK